MNMNRINETKQKKNEAFLELDNKQDSVDSFYIMPYDDRIHKLKHSNIFYMLVLVIFSYVFFLFPSIPYLIWIRVNVDVIFASFFFCWCTIHRVTRWNNSQLFFCVCSFVCNTRPRSGTLCSVFCIRNCLLTTESIKIPCCVAY